jgi:hypothetical protein
MITPNQYTGLMVNYSKARYGRFGEPFPIPVENPSALSSAVAYHMKVLGYTPEEMASLLMMDKKEFNETYSASPVAKQSHLRVVS